MYPYLYMMAESAGSDESSFSEASDEDRGEAEVPYLIYYRPIIRIWLILLYCMEFLTRAKYDRRIDIMARFYVTSALIHSWHAFTLLSTHVKACHEQSQARVLYGEFYVTYKMSFELT